MSLVLPKKNPEGRKDGHSRWIDTADGWTDLHLIVEVNELSKESSLTKKVCHYVIADHHGNGKHKPVDSFKYVLNYQKNLS